MSANPFIELVARLKKDEASIGLIKKDIESIASILNRQQALKVVCHINTEVTKHLQGELNQLSKNLNLNVGVNTQGVNSNNSTTTNIKIDSTGAKKQADELTNIITQQLQGKASNSITSFVNSIRTQLDDSSKIWTTWNRTAEGALTSFTVSIQKAEGEVNKFKFFANGDEFALLRSVGSDKGELQNAEKILAEIEKSYQKITAESQTILNPKSTDYRKTVAEARVAEQETLIRQKTEELQLAGLLSSEVSKQISYYHQISAEDILTYRSQQESLSQTRQQTEEIKKQQETYDNIVSSLNKYRNALSGFNTSNITKQNASNTDVQKQVAENQILLEQIEKISQLLSGGKKNTSATHIEQARQALESLIPILENAKKSNESLNQSLMDGKAEQALASRINNLINQMNKFANTNPKVTKSLKQMRDGMTFADKWQQMVNMLQSGKLDDNAVQQLTNDFRNFRGEADSANLTTSRFFTSMQTQLRMVLQRWISLYAVIGYIRKMIDNIKELDTAMINLQRVTHETGEGYERFLANASDRAKELKTTTSALIEQSYQWAKLGYDMEDSLKLSEASTIFSRVADVGQEQAVKNLVTAMKAYGIEAEDVMSIVDKLDKLNNEYAVSAAGLGDGLERAASAMAMTGNSIDQTLAMLTGAGEITQNLENTANGLRIVGLR